MNHGLPVYTTRISKAVLDYGGSYVMDQLRMAEKQLHRNLDKVRLWETIRTAGLPERSLCRFYNISEDEHYIIIKIWIGVE